jgi:hypothetical protein
MRNSQFKTTVGTILGVTLLSPAPWIFAKAKSTEAHAKQIETVLDKLEQRLIDKESSPLTLEEAEQASKTKSNEPKRIQKFVPKASGKIKGNTPSGKNLQELQRNLNEYDNRIEILESDLRKLGSSVQEAAATDNQVALEIRTANDSKIMIRTLTATLDGNTLYSQVDPAGLWMPARAIPLFYGPLQPGSHKIEINGFISPSTDLTPSGPSWRQKSIKQSFSFDVPEGKTRKTIAIEISDSQGDGQPIAKIQETEAQ